MSNFTKIVRLGSMPGGGASTFCKIEWDGHRLSITGVEGPTRGGNARGGCGQILDRLEVQSYAPGWSADLLERFRAIWKRWHLNDTRPGCEHQRDWPTTEKVELVTYKLTSEALSEQNRIKAAALKRLHQDGTATINAQEREVLALPYTTTQAPPGLAVDGVASGRYEVKTREQKALGFIRPDEHPDGLLCKPCPECGYKYGSGWRYEAVPDDVLNFLRGLPETDKKPAWV